MADPCPIGMFDSGVGGLAVLAEVRRLLPHENLIYYADSAHFPYGDRTEDFIHKRAAAVTEELLSRGCKLIVIACNTATSAAAERLRTTFSVPFVAMEPAVKPAAQRTRAGRVAVLATPGTVEGRRLAELMERHGNGADVRAIAAPGLAAAIEAGDLAPEALLREALAPVLAEGIDALALGCTHYFFLRPIIERIVGSGVEVIDTAAPVARRVAQVLKERALLTPSARPGRVTYLTSGDARAFSRVRALLGAVAGIPGESG